MSSITLLLSKLCTCAYTCDFDSEPNNSFVSTTMPHGLANTRTPAGNNIKQLLNKQLLCKLKYLHKFFVLHLKEYAFIQGVFLFYKSYSMVLQAFNYRLTHLASELSGFTCTSSITMNKKFQHRTRRPRRVLKNFEFIVSERVQVSPVNSQAMSALTFYYSN